MTAKLNRQVNGGVSRQGHARYTRWRKAIERALSHQYGSVDKGLAFLANEVVKKAAAGDRDSLIEVGLRFDGRPVQPAPEDGAGDVRIVISATDLKL